MQVYDLIFYQFDFLTIHGVVIGFFFDDVNRCHNFQNLKWLKNSPVTKKTGELESKKLKSPTGPGILLCF